MASELLAKLIRSKADLLAEEAKKLPTPKKEVELTQEDKDSVSLASDVAVIGKRIKSGRYMGYEFDYEEWAELLFDYILLLPNCFPNKPVGEVLAAMKAFRKKNGIIWPNEEI